MAGIVKVFKAVSLSVSACYASGTESCTLFILDGDSDFWISSLGGESMMAGVTN